MNTNEFCRQFSLKPSNVIQRIERWVQNNHNQVIFTIAVGPKGGNTYCFDDKHLPIIAAWFGFLEVAIQLTES